MDSDDSSTQTTETDLEFSPETLQALGIEFTTQFGQLDPTQREELMRAIGLAINQPGAFTESRPPPRDVTPGAAQPATTRAIQQTGTPPAQVGQIIEGLRGGAQRANNVQVRQASSTLSPQAGILRSFVDPRSARALQPAGTTSTSGGGQGNFQTGLQAAATAATIAQLVYT